MPVEDAKSPIGTNLTLCSVVLFAAGSQGSLGRFRPKGDMAALQQTAAHSITSSARASNEGGTVRPSDFAVLRLMTSSNLVLC